MKNKFLNTLLILALNTNLQASQCHLYSSIPQYETTYTKVPYTTSHNKFETINGKRVIVTYTKTQYSTKQTTRLTGYSKVFICK